MASQNTFQILRFNLTVLWGHTSISSLRVEYHDHDVDFCDK